MNSLHPVLRRMLRQSKPEPVSPSPFLEDRIIAAWRSGQSLEKPETLPTLGEFRLFLGTACALLLLACFIAWPTLRAPTDVSLLVANSALLSSLSHENH